MIMKLCYIPSLKHICCSDIVSRLFEVALPLIEAYCLKTSRLLNDNSIVLYMDREKIYDMIYKKVSERIDILISCTPLQETLKSSITPLFCEIENWLKLCKTYSVFFDDSLLFILQSIPSCWLSNGSIDREKSAKMFVKNDAGNAASRFIFACNFCLLDDSLYLWKLLHDDTKLYLKYHADNIVKQWISWLESSSKKNMQSFIEWALEAGLWKDNVYILKYVYKALNSTEKSHYLSYALTRKGVSSDIMYFGLSLMSQEEQEVIFKESPVELFGCITSWPMQSCFFDIVDILMPHLTCDSFCDILDKLLSRIKIQERNFQELIIILKKFWAVSPLNFKNYVKSVDSIYEPLQIILEYNSNEDFPIQRFSDLTDDSIFSITPFVI